MSWISIIVYYLIIYTIIIKLLKKEYKYLFLFLFIIFIHHNINYLNSYYLINFFNIGQGDTALIIFPYNKSNILIDCANDSKNIIIPYLKSQGINKINYLIITHGDNDHMGEAINLVNNFKVERIIFNCGEFNDLEKELIKVLNKKKIKYYSCIDKLDDLYFLKTREYDNENDNSSVIYTELNDYKFMFMGDAGVEKEKDILDKYNISNIDVLKVGHHGSKTSSSKYFINEINPKYSIISVGKNNIYGHPNKEVLNNLGNSKVYRTDKDGSIMFKIKNNKLKIETCSP
jgi:competence protein ComEC